MQYNLKQVNERISKCNGNVKVRLGEFRTFIKSKKYIWMAVRISTYTKSYAKYLI